MLSSLRHLLLLRSFCRTNLAKTSATDLQNLSCTEGHLAAKQLLDEVLGELGFARTYWDSCEVRNERERRLAEKHYLEDLRE